MFIRIVFVFFYGGATFFVVNFHMNEVSAHGVEPTIANVISIADCLHHTDKEERTMCYLSLCDPSYDCAGSLVTAATVEEGAAAGFQVTEDVLKIDAYAANGFEHELAHVVGRTLAKEKGSSGDVFLTCPEIFQYGCMHGFFEQALLRSADIASVAKDICTSITGEPLERNRFFCEHGVGHGIMMARSNHVGRSLFLCDQAFPDGSDGCYQGVFHENIKAYGQGEARKGAFLSFEPLFPCSVVPDQYQWGCYMRHATYLMSLEDLHWKRAIRHCLLASEDMIPVCLSEFGQLAVDVRWQSEILKRSPGFDRGDFLENAAALCDALPSAYISRCNFGAIDHTINHMTIDDAVKYCFFVSAESQSSCAEYVGNQLRKRAIDEASIAKWCAIFPVSLESACLEGDWDASNPSIHDLPFVIRVYRFIAGGTLWMKQASFNMLSNTNDLYVIADRPLSIEPGEEVIPAATIVFNGSAFQPNEVTVLQGEAVRWLNSSDEAFWPASDVHPTHETYSAFDAQLPQQSGSDYVFIFNQKGDWTFHDHLHPETLGIVHVR